MKAPREPSAATGDGDSPARPAEGLPSAAIPTLLFVLLCVAISAAAFSYYRIHQRAHLEEKERELEEIATLKVAAVESWRRDRLGDAAALAADPFLGRAAARLEAGRAEPGLRRELAGWLAEIRRTSGYEAVAIADARGRVLVVSGAEPGALAPAPSLVEETRRAGRPVLSEILRDARSGRLHLDILAPLASAGSEPAFAVFRDDPARLLKLVRSWPTPNATAEALLVRRDGDEVVYLSPVRHGAGGPMALRLPLGRADLPAARVVLGEESVVRGRDYRGADVLAAMRHVPGSPWFLVAKIDVAEALAPLGEHVRWLLAVVVSLVAASAASLGLWWHQQSAGFHRRQGRAEAERSELLRQLDWIARYGNDMMFLADDDLRIVAANDRAVAALGYERSELLQRRIPDIRDPATVGDVEEIHRRELANEALIFETRYRRKDGTTFPVELSTRAITIEGRRYWQGIARDITDRRRAEEALRASEQKFRAAFHQASIGTMIVDREGRISEFNRAFQQMMGHPADDLRGKTLAEITHPDDAALSLQVFQEMVEGTRDSFAGEKRYLRKDGGAAQAIVRTSAVRDADGHFLFNVATIEDVTEKRAMEARLLLADRMASIGTLAAGVAHEINNPLAFTLANLAYSSEQLRRAAAPPANVLRALEEATEGAIRVRDIVRDLRTFSREGDPPGGASDVRKVLRSSIALAQNEMRHRARLAVDIREVPPVGASEQRLGQVFLNLLVNAAQAIPEGHAEENRIGVVARVDGSGRVAVEVQDTGCGIPDHVIGRIFDPFFTTKPVGVGTGLGLFICHGIVSALGGEIQVESRPGRGSTFRVLLPAARPAEAAPAPAPPPPEPVARARILVVDDEPMVGRALVRILSPQHEVVTATSAREALQALADRPGFDVVVCDLMMPDTTGMDLYAEISRLHPPLAERMVFLTGGAFTARAREFLERVPNPRVEKPFEPQAIREVVGVVVGRRLRGGPDRAPPSAGPATATKG